MGETTRRTHATPGTSGAPPARLLGLVLGALVLAGPLGACSATSSTPTTSTPTTSTPTTSGPTTSGPTPRTPTPNTPTTNGATTTQPQPHHEVAHDHRDPVARP